MAPSLVLLGHSARGFSRKAVTPLAREEKSCKSGGEVRHRKGGHCCRQKASSARRTKSTCGQTWLLNHASAGSWRNEEATGAHPVHPERAEQGGVLLASGTHSQLGFPEPSDSGPQEGPNSQGHREPRAPPVVQKCQHSWALGRGHRPFPLWHTYKGVLGPIKYRGRTSSTAQSLCLRESGHCPSHTKTRPACVLAIQA